MSVHPPPAPVRVRPRTASAAATLDHAAEFSAFPGQDRVFIVAAGTLELTIDGITRFLSLGDEQRFPGEAGAHADPGAEPAFALNVMSARVSHVAEVAVIRIDGPVPQAGCPRRPDHRSVGRMVTS